ncbi:hypothetical protein AAVH_17196 [Aphelenchoides avenae]|nr:hypothetical protein AAVH_17196 [Aphelenchus avenae]
MKLSLACIVFAAVFGAFLLNESEALDCRRVLFNINCSAANGAAQCTNWCRQLAWNTGTCQNLTAPCPFRANGSRICYCN